MRFVIFWLVLVFLVRFVESFRLIFGLLILSFFNVFCFIKCVLNWLFSKVYIMIFLLRGVVVVKLNWNNEEMYDIFDMIFYVIDFYVMSDWVLIVCIVSFLFFFYGFLGINMKGSGVVVVVCYV